MNTILFSMSFNTQNPFYFRRINIFNYKMILKGLIKIHHGYGDKNSGFIFQLEFIANMHALI